MGGAVVQENRHTRNLQFSLTLQEGRVGFDELLSLYEGCRSAPCHSWLSGRASILISERQSLKSCKIAANDRNGMAFFSSFSGLARSKFVGGMGRLSYVDIADCNAWHDCGGVLIIRCAIK